MERKPPVFIVGSPRSGTNLLRNMFNRHPLLAICHETRFYGYVYKRRRAFGDLRDPKNRRRLVEQYLSTERIGRMGLDLARLGDKLLREGDSYRAVFTCILEWYAESMGKPRYGEKTPHHALFTETLFEWYPGAKIIHLLRDPRDVAASLKRMPWAPNAILENAGIWRLFNRAARRSRHRPGYLPVYYETLVSQPEQELTRICAHLGEAYAPEMLLPGQPVSGAYSWPKSTHGAVTTERLGKWREELTTEEVALTEWAAGELMQTLGYERAAGSPSVLAIARGVGLSAYDAVRRQVEQFPCMWYHWVQPTKIAQEEYWRNWRSWQKAPTTSGMRHWNTYLK
jgi:hypothetical protein